MGRDRYLEIDAKRLEELWAGMDILESVDLDKLQEFDLFLYGLTTSETIVDAAKESIADNADLSEEDVELSEVAVAIPLGADSIRILLGSGFTAKREDFAYMGTGGEGIRKLSFIFSSFKPTLAVSEFTTMALAQSDAWLDDFLKQYGNKQPAVVKENVRRDEEATQPNVPASAETPAPAAVPPATPPAIPGTPKKTSQIGGLKLAEVIEEFLK